MYTLVNQVSVKPLNCNVGYVNSWLSVLNNAQREFCAQAAYITNFDDMMITLSASNVTIGAVEIKDWNSNLRADVIEDNGYHSLRVLSQDLESSVDDITIGDKNGNFATVNKQNSALQIYVTNPQVTVLNPVTAVSVLNFPIEQTITGVVTALQSNTPYNVSIINPVTSVEATITNTVTAVIDTLETGGLPITFLNTSTDAFGRLRTSSPLTIFDSTHRFQDNSLWATLTSNGGSFQFNNNQGLIDLNVTTSSGSEVIRETTKTFSYQAGKSLLTLNTFVMAPSAENLRQRVGYFGSENGIFLELDGVDLNIVKRTTVNGTIENIKVKQSDWNVDKLDGSGLSGKVLDITKAQILWMDFEWLGVGTVRLGFVIDGKFIHCHSFNHANLISSTYIKTASLPIRYEITNTGENIVNHTLKQICSTVISEGGYELRGQQQSVYTPINSPKTLSTAGTFYPVISIRLKQSRLDAIAILSNVSLMGIGNGINFQWRLVGRSVTSGGTWDTTGLDSSVEYNIGGVSVSGGKIITGGFLNSSNQGSPTITIPRTDLFKFQLERDSLNSLPYEISLQVTSSNNTQQVFGLLDWEEITR